MIAREAPDSNQTAPAGRQGLLHHLFGRPLVPAAAVLCLGIATHGSVWGTVAAAAALILAAWLLRKFVPLSALLICSLFLPIGWMRQAVSSAPTASDISQLIGVGYVTLSGTVVSDPEPSRFTTSLLLRVSAVDPASGPVHAYSGLVYSRIPNGIGPVQYGDGLELRGALQEPGGPENPGLFRFPEYLARLGVYSAIVVRRESSAKRIPGSAHWLDRLARGMQSARQSLIKALDRLFDPVKASLLSGIVLGQRTRLPAALKDDFSMTGTTHILASSGMNVGILAAAVFGLARWARIRRSRAVWLVIPALLLYTLLAGAKPSIVRADVMATVFLLAYALNREPDVPSAMALAALILLLWQPANLFDPGFQLSFVVVGTLVGVMPDFEDWPQGTPTKRPSAASKLGRAIMAGLIMSFIAQIAALPLTAQHFNQVSVVGIAANALILLVIPPLYIGGMLLWALTYASAWLTTALAWPIDVLLTYVLGVAQTLGASPLAVLNVPSPGWPAVALYYAIFAWAIRQVRLKSARYGAAERESR